MRSRLVALSLVGAVMALAGCGSSDSSDTGSTPAGQTGTTTAAPLKIAFAATQANAFQAQQTAQARKWAEANNAELTVVDPGLDAQKQFTQIQDLIAQKKVDGLLIAPLNGPALAPLAKQADAAGIATVAVNYPLGSDYSATEPQVPGVSGLVWKPLTNVGEILAQQVADACEGVEKCEAVYLSISPTLPAEKAMYSGFEAAMKEHPDITVLPQLGPTMGQRGPAVGLTQDLLQAHPDVDVIVATDAALLGSEVALKKANKTAGTQPADIRLVGWGGTKQGVQRVADGTWVSTQVTLPDETITDALEIIKDKRSGALTAPKGVDPIEDSKYPAIIDKDAVEKTGFTGEYSG
jgi:ribose transport system substrate-binding protein